MTGDADRDGPRDGSIEGPPGGSDGGRAERADGGQEPGPRPEETPADKPEIDIESAFAAIVASYGAQPVAGVGPWPALEDVDTDEEPRRRAGDRRDPPDEDPDPDPYPDPRSAAPPGTPVRRIIPGEPVEELEERDDAEGYVPPEPPPLPAGDTVSRLAWAGVLGGPVFLLVAALAWNDLPAVLLMAALGAFVGGFVTLVARMPGRPPDDPDDGAVV